MVRKLAQRERLVLGVVALAWVALFSFKFWPLTTNVGFDYSGHREYIDRMLEDPRPPLAGESWSSYHPPLFYWLAAGVKGLLEGVAGGKIVKVIPFLCGLANVLLAWALVRRLHPERPSRALVAALFAGFLPVNIYMSAYISNESLSGTLIGTAIVITVVLLVSDRPRWTLLVGLGLLLGLALLTKFTVVVVIPWILLFVAYRFLVIDGDSLLRAATRTLVIIAVTLSVAGWYYARNIAHFDQPLVFNWEVGDGDRMWWQMPGFHTLDYYRSFGESLRYPFFSGFVSFWDGLYSSFWGDGYLAGRPKAASRHDGWNYSYMSACYLLAAPMLLVFALGAGRLVHSTVRESEARRRVASAFVVCSLLAFLWSAVYYSLRAPMYSAVKSFFALGLVPALALIVVEGFRTVDRVLRARPLVTLRIALYAWWGTVLVVSYLSYIG
jgi:hypothetical protein